MLYPTSEESPIRHYLVHAFVWITRGMMSWTVNISSLYISLCSRWSFQTSSELSWRNRDLFQQFYGMWLFTIDVVEHEAAAIKIPVALLNIALCSFVLLLCIKQKSQVFWFGFIPQILRTSVHGYCWRRSMWWSWCENEDCCIFVAILWNVVICNPIT